MESWRPDLILHVLWRLSQPISFRARVGWPQLIDGEREWIFST